MTYVYKSYTFNIYMYKKELVLNNLQWLRCHKNQTKPNQNQAKPNQSRNLSGIMVNVQDFGLEVSEFELQTRYYVYFRTNTLVKGMNPLIPPVIG